MKDWQFAILVLAVVCIAWFLWSPWSPRGFAQVADPWEEPIVVENIMTPEECKQIIAKVDYEFEPSHVVGNTERDPQRTSETAWISKNDPVVEKIVLKAQELTGKPIENLEDVQVVRYRPGTFYNAHHDSCCDATDGCREFEREGGQRVGTLLVYLNSDFTEGQTHFPKHNDMKIKVNPGSAVFFRPLCSSNSKCHPKALHAGLPIGDGTKYVCNVWVRENNFRSQL
jgi:prolyl 4-hydroxylase